MKRADRRRFGRLGQATAVAGMLLAVTGVVVNPAAAGNGNNGTIKVDEQGLENGPGGPNSNDPHIDCAGRIEWYGFDENAVSDVTFEVQAPTANTAPAGAPTSTTYSDVPIVDGDGPGGTSLDGQLDFDLSDLLASYQPHPKQGYHVKVTAETTDSRGSDVKHKVFWVQPCAGDELGGLTIDKAVTGDDLPAADTAFGFTLACEVDGDAVDLNGDDPGDTATFTLTATDPAESFPLLPTGATCTVTETDDQDADGTTWTGGTAIPDANGVSVTIGNATTVAVVATNAFNTTGGSTFGALSVNKDVSGDDVPAATTEFGFDVDCSNGVEESFELTAGDPAHVISGLPTGTTCTVTETDDQDADGTTWTGGTAIPGANGVSVTIGNATTVAVTATNDFDATVLPEVIVPETPERPNTVTPNPAVEPTANVKGEVVTRAAAAQLPRTGTDALPLFQVGLGLILVGAGVMLFGRERSVLIPT